MSDQDGTEASGAGETFYWNVQADGSWNSTSSWLVGSDKLPATTSPGADDNVYISENYGMYYTFVTGIGQSNSLNLGFGVALDGQFTTGTLTSDGAILRYPTELTSGSSLTATTALISGGFDLNDASMSVSGLMTVQNVQGSIYSALDILSGSRLEIQSLTIGYGGGVNVDATSSARIGSSDVDHTGYLTISSGSELLLTGVSNVGGAIWNDGLIEIDNPFDPGSGFPGHEAQINQGVAGTGSIQIDADSLLAINGTAVDTQQNITFKGQNSQLVVGNTKSNTAVDEFSTADLQHLTGFDSTDEILFDPTIVGMTYTINGTTSATVDVDVLSNGEAGVDQFTFLGDYSGRTFYAVPSDSSIAASAFTVSAVPCFCPGTLISTIDGEVAVETLAIGNPLLTADGRAKPILWIGRRFYPRHLALGRKDLQPILILAGALGGGLPRRDLMVSPEHAVLVAGHLVPAGLLVNGVSILREEVEGELFYIHIELQDHDLLLAEGAVVESFVDDHSRAMFDNAAEYHRLYPNRPSHSPAWCAPRVECGPELVAAQRHVDLLAGLGGREPVLKLLGQVDESSSGRLRGWAWCPDHPSVPVLLEALAGDEVVATMLADRFRADLLHAGIGNGCHGFELATPIPGHALCLRRAVDGAQLAA